MHIFHTYFAIFGQKIFFFENPAPSVFRSSKKLPWYQKSENSNEPFEWKLLDWLTDWLIDRRTDEGKSIGPYLIGRSKKPLKNIKISCQITDLSTGSLTFVYIWFSDRLNIKIKIKIKAFLHRQYNILRLKLWLKSSFLRKVLKLQITSNISRLKKTVRND